MGRGTWCRQKKALAKSHDLFYRPSEADGNGGTSGVLYFFSLTTGHVSTKISHRS